MQNKSSFNTKFNKFIIVVKKYENIFFIGTVIVAFMVIIFIFYRFLNENLISFQNGDAYAHVWWLWSKRINYLSNLPSSYSVYRGYPFGVYLDGVIMNSPLFHYISLLLIRFFNEIFTYNLINLISYPLSIIFTYFLIKYFTNDSLSSIFGSLVFTFSPYHLIRSMGHLYLAQIEWWPLLFLTLFLFIERNNTKFTLLASLSVVLLFFTDYYYGYFSAITIAIFFGYLIFRKLLVNKNYFFKVSIKNIAIFFSVIIMMTAPIIYKILKAYQQAQGSLTRTSADIYKYTAKGWEYFLPIPDNPLVPKLKNLGFLTKIPFRDQELWVYVGIIVIILSLVGLFARIGFVAKKESILFKRLNFFKPFLITLIISIYILSLKPEISIVNYKIHLPSYYLFKIFPMFRVYSRTVVIIMIPLAILASLGLKFILSKFKSFGVKSIVTAIFILFLSLDFAYKPPSNNATAMGLPELYKYLLENRTNENYSTVSFNISEDNFYLTPPFSYIFYQRIHRVPLVNAYNYFYFYPQEKDKLQEQYLNILDDLKKDEDLKILGLFGTKYLILNYDNENTNSKIMDYYRHRKGLTFIKNFGNQDLFRINYFTNLQDVFIPEKIIYFDGDFLQFKNTLNSFNHLNSTAFYLSKIDKTTNENIIKENASDVIFPIDDKWLLKSNKPIIKPDNLKWDKLSDSNYLIKVESKKPFFFVLNKPYKFNWKLKSSNTNIKYEIFRYNGYGCLIYLITTGHYSFNLYYGETN